MEFRHPEWFEGGAAAEEVWACMLEAASVPSSAIRAAPGCRSCGDAPFLLLRFGGYEGHLSTATLADWCLRTLEKLGFSRRPLGAPARQLHTPETCRLFSELAATELDLNVRAPMPTLL